MSVNALLEEFKVKAATPKQQLAEYKAQGKKVVGVLPYYAPEELVYAAGIVPMGMWGSNTKTISRAKEYCATFYCTIAQLALEMLLDGTMDQLDGIITPTICDTLRPMSQNFRVAMGDKMKVIFLAHPQNRFEEFGLQFCIDQYNHVKADLEEIAGRKITDSDIQDAIVVYNKSRAARREFVKLANEHCDVITPTKRSAVLKAFYFMEKPEYTAKLVELNAELAKLPVCDWKGTKVVTSGIICDNPKLLSIFEENNIAIAADDVAHETRSFRVDAPEDELDPVRALAKQFANIDYEVLLYEGIDTHHRQNAQRHRGQAHRLARHDDVSVAGGLCRRVDQNRLNVNLKGAHGAGRGVHDGLDVHVPGVHRHEQRDGRQRRQRKRQDDPEEGDEGVGAVDGRRLLQLARNAQKEGLDDHNVVRRRQGRDNQRPIGVQDAQISNVHIVRNQAAVEQQGEDHHAHDELPAGELLLGQAVAEAEGGEHAQERGRRRDDQRILQRHHEILGLQNRGVDLQREFLGNQAELIGHIHRRIGERHADNV